MEWGHQTLDVLAGDTKVSPHGAPGPDAATLHPFEDSVPGDGAESGDVRCCEAVSVLLVTPKSSRSYLLAIPMPRWSSARTVTGGTSRATLLFCALPSGSCASTVTGIRRARRSSATLRWKGTARYVMHRMDRVVRDSLSPGKMSCVAIVTVVSALVPACGFFTSP